MSEKELTDTPELVDSGFWDDINWEQVALNKIGKKEFLITKSVNNKLYCTFLGPGDQLQFYMFKPLSWGKYKDIKDKQLDKDTTREYIINACVIWPKTDPIFVKNLDAGIMLTLANQILTVSNFLQDPSKALELILELE